MILKQSWGCFGSLLFLLGWIGFLVCGATLCWAYWMERSYFDTSGGILERFHSGSQAATDKVAVIGVVGVIGPGRGFTKQQIDRVKKDKHIKAIVLRINSPGGTVAGSDYLHHHLVQLRDQTSLPIVVSMGSVAASGGYYVAMAAGDQPDLIFAEPTTTTGSIGVLIPHYDVSGLMDKYNVKDDSLATHPRKKLLSMTQPMSDDHRQILERYLDESFTRFKDIVKAGRAKFAGNPEALDELATGEIFTANQALANGLVDKIGFIEDAIERAAELARLGPDKYKTVRYTRPMITATDVLGLAQADRASWSLETMLELSTPQAYYLATSLPPLVDTYQWQRDTESE